MSTGTSTRPEEPVTSAPSRVSVQSASSWVLRVGVLLSLTVMVAGLVRALVDGGVTVHEMETRPFSGDAGAILRGSLKLQAFPLMELGVVLLVLTPILRVFTSMVLFAFEEHDRLYTAVTFVVLVLTVSALLFIR
jgi:uncharacterized membrane protein